MALYKSTDLDKLRQHVPVKGDFNMELLLSLVPDVEAAHLIPYLSEDQYAVLDAAYNVATPNLTAAQEALLERCQAAIAPLAMVEYADVGNVDISNSGIRVSHDEHSKSAFEWQIYRLQKRLFEIGMARIDQLLVFMEANKGDYTPWATSDTYTRQKERIVPDARTFSRIYGKLKNSRILYLMLVPLMEQVEEDVLEPLMGSALLTQIRTELVGGSVSAPNKAILPMMQKCVAYHTVSRALVELPIELAPHGLSLVYLNDNRDNYHTSQPATGEKLSPLLQQTENTGRHYAGMLKGYLDANYVQYPDYPYADDDVEINDNPLNRFYST